MTTETKKAPVAKIRAGSVTASIWENVKDGKTKGTAVITGGPPDT